MNASTSQETKNIEAATSGQKSKPRRKDFFTTIVVASNGSTVAPTKWQPLVQDLPVGSRKIAKVLKKHNMQPVPIFLEDQYQAAKQAYYAEKHQNDKAERAKMIEDACKEAGCSKTRHIEASLRTLLPLFKNVSADKTKDAFKGIVKAIAASGAVKEFEDREKARTERKASRGHRTGSRRGRKPAAQQSQPTTH